MTLFAPCVLFVFLMTSCSLFSAFGYLMTFGDNKYGQLGDGDFRERSGVCMVSGPLAGQRVTKVNCGDGFTVMATAGQCGDAFKVMATAGQCGDAVKVMVTAGQCGDAFKVMATAGQCGDAFKVMVTAGQCGDAFKVMATSAVMECSVSSSGINLFVRLWHFGQGVCQLTCNLL